MSNRPTIASLLPSTTEMACSLGLMDRIVAISHECDYPSAVKGLEAITSSIIPHGLSQLEIDDFVVKAMRAGKSLYGVDAERLSALSPDLVLTQGLCDVCAVTPDVIQTSLRGVQCDLPASCRIVSMNGTSFAEICQDLLDLGTLTSTQTVAEQRVAEAKKQWTTIEQPTKEKPNLLLLEWIEPFFSAGHWVPEQIVAAGGVSAIGTPSDKSRKLTIAEVVASSPTHIGVVCCGFNLEKNISFASQLYQMPELAAIPAIQTQQVWAFDANSYFSRPTLRIARGAWLIGEMFAGRHSNGESQRIVS